MDLVVVELVMILEQVLDLVMRVVILMENQKEIQVVLVDHLGTMDPVVEVVLVLLAVMRHLVLAVLVVLVAQEFKY